MQDPQKQINEYLEKLIFRFIYIRSLQRQINQISEWLVPGKIQAFNIGSHFFELTRWSFGWTVLLELCKLVSNKEHKSLLDWLLKAKENSKVLQPSKHKTDYDSGRSIIHLKPEEYAEIIDSHLAEINKHNDIIHRLKVRRDKVIAHNDRTYFNNSEKLFKDYPLNDLDISSLMDTIADILKEHYLLLLHADMSMEISSLSDVDNVLKYVRAFSRVRKDKRVTRDCGIRIFKYLQDDYNEEDDKNH